MAFGVAEGVVGLAGQPGSGKTTLLATFATLRRPSTGALRILGHDAGNSAGLRAIRARVGYLPARISFAANMTAGEFVGYAAYYKGMRAPAARAALKRLDLADAAGTELAHLPPDVRLRAGLAATCVHEPDLVLLDEPLAGLSTGRPGDAAAARELIPLLRSLAPTVIVTAEAEDDLGGWCDRVLTLARGRLTDGTSVPVGTRPGDSGDADPTAGGPLARSFGGSMTRALRGAVRRTTRATARATARGASDARGDAARGTAADGRPARVRAGRTPAGSTAGV
ncbi:ATP-binding cassette domain-containing protein [Actinomadura rubteroloni]|uniref:ATP-binding cassette domain-containing protein n=1 Tax=Actinomadura rubteroloni TaxID=1926885 RepID=UPI001F406AA3|nr:ATP-binding cassette domain-containing protein [Actinomadura rubteroloni]